MGRDLPRFEDYRRSIRCYLRRHGISLRYAEVDGDGCYRVGRKCIIICPDLPETTEIAVILHELGHHLDEFLGGICHTTTRYYSESRAWNLGRVIAARLDIPLGAWYRAEEKDALHDYRMTRGYAR